MNFSTYVDCQSLVGWYAASRRDAISVTPYDSVGRRMYRSYMMDVAALHDASLV